MTFLFLNVLLRWLRRRASASAAELSGTRLVFSAPDVKAFYAVGSVVAIAILLTLVDSSEPLWSAAVPVLFLGLFLYFWPADVEISDSGVAERTWWGKRSYLAWRDVSSMAHRPGDGCTFVLAADGREVRHTGFHCDPARFQAEVKARAEITQMSDWDAVPSLLAAR